MKPKKSKYHQSEELAQAIDAFLEEGGSINQIPRGLSGNTDNTNLFQNKTAFEPKSTRTPLTEVVKTLEERKQKRKSPSQQNTQLPKKKLIVDDFGDPLRWVWEDKK